MLIAGLVPVLAHDPAVAVFPRHVRLRASGNRLLARYTSSITSGCRSKKDQMETQLSGPAAHKKARIEGLLDTRPKGKDPIGLVSKR
jgi:hypothetical protein